MKKRRFLVAICHKYSHDVAKWVEVETRPPAFDGYEPHHRAVHVAFDMERAAGSEYADSSKFWGEAVGIGETP